MGGSRIKRNSGKNAKTLMVIPLLLGFFAVVFLSAPLAAEEQANPANQQEVLVDRLVAEVNGEPIAYSEVMDKVKNGPLVEVAPYPAQEDDPPFEVALQDLINSKLIMQKAEEYEIEVTDEEVEQEIQRFLERRNLSADGLKEALSQQGMTMEQYRKDFKNQMILSKFQGGVILPAVKITDKDVEIFYLRTSGTSAENLKLQLRQIFIKLDGKASESVKKGKEDLVETVHQKLKDGMSFEEAAKVYSDDPSGRQNGGAMPLIFLKDMASTFRTGIEPLKEGEFSAPIQTPMGYYFFYLEKKTFAGNSDFDRKKRELEMQLRQEEVGKQTMRWLADERKRSKVKVHTDGLKIEAAPKPKKKN